MVVLEANELGSGASGRSTGMLGPGVGQSLPALVRRLGAERAAALYRATLGSVADVRRLVESERLDCELHLGGQLVVARTAGSRRRLATLASMLHSLELPGEALDDAALAREVRFAEGVVAGRAEEGPAAVRLPDAGTLHPGKLLEGLADRVTALGGEIFSGARVSSIGDAKPVRLELPSGELIADEVVVATGGYTDSLGMLRGRVLPVHLQVVVSEPLSHEALGAIGWASRAGMLDARRIFNYFRLTDDNRIVFGGGTPRYRWGGRSEDVEDVAPLEQLAHSLTQTFPAEVGVQPAFGWTGVIDYTVDAMPLIQRWRENDAVVHVVGWCGHGIALSVASGAWVTHLLCDGAAPEDLPWYRNQAPLIPFAPVRWLGFQATVGMMSALDRMA